MLSSALGRLARRAVLAGLPVLVAAPAPAQPVPSQPVPAQPVPAQPAPAQPVPAPAPSPASDSEPTAAPAPMAPAAEAAAPEPAQATPGPLSLTWNSADPSCEGSAVGPRALELVTRNVVPRPLEARATVAREGERWIVQLETRSHDRMGQRTLRGESCKEIQQAISLLLAMIMEAEARGEAAPPTPPPPPEPLNMSDPDEDPVTDDAPLAVPPARDRDYVLRTEGSAAVGLQPSLGLGVALSVGMAWGALEAHLGGSYWPSSRIPIFERDGVFEMRRQSAGISLCYRWLNSGRVALLSCLGPEWLWMQWRSKGLSDNDNGAVHHLMTLNGTSELRLAAVGPMFVTLTPGFTWEQRRHFTARRCEGCGPTDVFHTWDLGVRFGAGIGARF